ncbi:MAG TPA: hypothetical protein VGR02_09900 [Thermoanaerobaculia bacterium]|jgi:hypothetical protein|nr:hypothetical protein [Thermoanaerobaculia bacterium]
MNRILLSFCAGFLATIVFHQLALEALHLAGVTPRAPFDLHGVPPFGIPSVLSLAFWGGVWGILMIPCIARVPGAAYWVVAAVFGAILPTLVAAFVVAPLKGVKLPLTGANIATGLIVNAAWGLGTAITYRLLRRPVSS